MRAGKRNFYQKDNSLLNIASNYKNNIVSAFKNHNFGELNEFHSQNKSSRGTNNHCRQLYLLPQYHQLCYYATHNYLQAKFIFLAQFLNFHAHLHHYHCLPIIAKQ